MGTKIQFKSYIPIHNVIRNKNEHSSSSWSWYCQDNVLSGHLYDGTLLRETNGYSLCDKEMLKRTMLEHEATFTKQVFELHRLYRIQKELMNELKNREKVKLCSTFQANLFTSHILSEVSEELRQMPNFCALSSHTTTVNVMELPLRHLKESATRKFQMPIETAGSSIEGHILNHKTINVPRKKFDLHLPAEAYMDVDDEAIAEKQNKPCLLAASPSSITHNAGDNDVKLSPMSKDDGSMNGSSRLCIQHENVSSRIVLADLNEPLKPLSYEEGEVSTFSQVIGSTMEHEEIMRHQLHSNKSSSSRGFLLGNLGQKQTASTSVNLDKVECLQGWQSSTNPSGEIRNTINGCHGELCYGEFSAISHLVKENPRNCDESVSPGRIKSDKWIGETSSPDTEINEGTSKLPNLNSSELASSQMPHPFASFSLSDNSSIPSPSIVSLTNLNNVKQISTAVQLLPSFNGYAVNNSRKADATFQIPCNPCDNVQYVDGSLKMRVKVDLPHEFHQALKKDSISPRQKCLPLIISKKSSHTNCLDNVTLGSCSVPHDPKCCSEGLLCAGVKQSLEPSCLRKNQAQSGPAGIEQSASHLMNLMSHPNALASSVTEQKNNKNEFTSMCSLLDCSSLHVMGRNEASCSQSSKRILEFPIYESTEQGVNCELSSVDIRNKVNIHSSASNSLVILPKDELPSSLFTKNISTKMTPMIDLKGLLDTEAEKDITAAEEESKELRCNLTTANKEVDLQLTNGSHEALIRGAAENLVAISLLIGNHYHDLTRPSISNSFDTLHWFADFVTSTKVNTGISREKSPQYDDDVDGLDMFEYMTMKLKEIKEDEFFYKPQENQNYDDTGTALLPMTRSQRGLERKRRQRRDFQEDILPGLASLSRHEISEDLQSFGGIMRASGKSWKTGLSRRSTSRKLSNLQARGRQRQRLTITVTEVKISSSRKKDANSKQEISTTGILSWGRTTRRCLRPRLLPGNLSVYPS